QFFGLQTGINLVDKHGNIKIWYIKSFDQCQLSVATATVWVLISRVNHYLVQREPWKLATSGTGENRSLLGAVLYTAADLLRTIAVLLWPIVPDSASRLWEQLGCEENLGKLGDQRIDDLQWGQLKPGTKVGKPEPIFPRLDKAKTLARLQELAEADRERDQSAKEALTRVDSESEEKQAAAAASPTSMPAGSPQSSIENRQSSIPTITIDDFAKVDLRVGTIVSAEPIPGAQKLLKLMVDVGTEVRQVCAGIAEYYEPAQLVGMKVVLVVNLAPRKLRGVESNGMVVAASVGENGKPVLATFKEDVPNGTRLK
ncbi:MAG: methionine--tRNA ligase subunit beta, partial [Terriglobia bacterium]